MILNIIRWIRKFSKEKCWAQKYYGSVGSEYKSDFGGYEGILVLGSNVCFGLFNIHVDLLFSSLLTLVDI